MAILVLIRFSLRADLAGWIASPPRANVSAWILTTQYSQSNILMLSCWLKLSGQRLSVHSTASSLWTRTHISERVDVNPGHSWRDTGRVGRVLTIRDLVGNGRIGMEHKEALIFTLIPSGSTFICAKPHPLKAPNLFSFSITSSISSLCFLVRSILSSLALWSPLVEFATG